MQATKTREDYTDYASEVAGTLPYSIQFPYQERESFTVGIEAQRIRASIQYVVSDGGRIAMFLAHTPATLCGGGGDYRHGFMPLHHIMGKGLLG